MQITTAEPFARDSYGLAYDSGRARTVLFGGFGSVSALGDTWEWDGVAWTQRTPPTFPQARFAPAMAYDSARRVVVLFGGRIAPWPYSAGNDTWEWDGAAGTWSQRAISGPPQRGYAAMAYDAARGRCVLFGGAAEYYPQYGDTWEWNGNSWSPGPPGPAIAAHHAMVFDSSRSRIVVLGGDGPAPGSIWEYDGASWAVRLFPGGPRLFAGAAAYDPLRARIVAHAGEGVTYSQIPATFELDPSGTAGWVQRSSGGPPGIQHAAMVFDSSASRCVFFGGNDGVTSTSGTWLWNGAAAGGPSITRQPAGQAIPVGQSAMFTVEAAGSGPLAYQWFHDTSPLVDGGRISGSQTPALNVANLRILDSGNYSVRVSATCGKTTSPTVYLLAECWADCDRRGSLNVDDLVCFQSAFAAAATLPIPQQIASYANCDASTTPPVLNVNDFVCFLSRFVGECR
jgi:hypothetical protein